MPQRFSSRFGFVLLLAAGLAVTSGAAVAHPQHRHAHAKQHVAQGVKGSAHIHLHRHIARHAWKHGHRIAHLRRDVR